MRIFFYFLLFVYVTLSVSKGIGQNLNKDSLLSLLELEKNDSVKIIHLTDISWEYCFSNTDSALVFAKKAVVLSNDVGDLLSKSKAMSMRATVHYVKSQFDLALKDYLIGLELDEKLNDSVGVAGDLLNIGSIYHSLKKYDQALEYYQESYELNKLIGDSEEVAIILGNIGAIHIHNKEYKAALNALEESLLLTSNQNQKTLNYQNIGVIYLEKEEYSKSLLSLKEALRLSELSNNDLHIARACSAIGRALLESGNPNEAIYYSERALAVSKEVGNKEQIEGALKKLSKIHAAMFDYQKAYEYRIEYSDMHDSIFNENSDKAIAEMETKYQTEKKEKENEILSQKNAIQDLENENQKIENESQKNEIAKQNTVIISTIVGILFLLGLAGLLIRSVRIKKAANTQINLQKDEIEEQRDEITEVNNELMASIEYAKNLQDAIIPKAAEISKGIANHFVFWLPRDIVSGDFYWYHKEGNDVYIAAADCTGHGVPGAFVSMACHNVLNQVVIDRHYSDPGIILQQVNNGIQKVFKKEGAISQAHDGMDIAFTKIDTANNKVIFAGALNSLLVVRGEDVIELKPDRKPIGGSAEVDSLYTEHVLELEKGDWLYMSSDGYQDQFGGVKGKKYKGKTFRKFLQEIATTSPEIQKEKLDKEFARWKGGFEQIDDVLVVGFNLD